eukprot:2590790-Prymnesium_polylepis.1
MRRRRGLGQVVSCVSKQVGRPCAKPRPPDRYLPLSCPTPDARPFVRSDVEVKPQEPRSESIGWFERKPGPPNRREMLFFSLFVVSVRKTASELDGWCST